MKKHEAFETDLQVHHGRVTEISTSGQQLIKEVMMYLKVFANPILFFLNRVIIKGTGYSQELLEWM